jgi:hypothetical protein
MPTEEDEVNREIQLMLGKLETLLPPSADPDRTDSSTWVTGDEPTSLESKY